jgi:hypothetical protein
MRRTSGAIAILALLASACSTGFGKPAEQTPAASLPATAAPVAPSAAAPLAVPSSPPADAVLPAAGKTWLVVAERGTAGLQVIAASTGDLLTPMPEGVPATAWTRLLTATPSHGRTVVAEFRVEDIDNPASLTLDGNWRLPNIGDDPQLVGLSGDASTLVLVDGSAGSATASSSDFAVLPASLHGTARVISLDGQFDFDALSTDGRQLFVVEHLAGPPAGHYQVRQVDVASGALQPGVVVDKRNIDEAMAGWPLGQVRLPGGRVLTLYRGTDHPFIHALDTVQTFAACIDLPATGAGDVGAARDWGIAQAGVGSVYAVNATLGLVLEVDPWGAQVRRSATVRPMAKSGIALTKFGPGVGGQVGRRVIVGKDGRSLYAAGAGGILAISTADLSSTGRWLEGQTVDGLALSDDGTRLFALLHGSGRIAVIDTAAGKNLGMVPGDGYTRLAAALPGE